MLRSNSLTSVVQREIARRILAGEIAAGAKLNEADLADQLKVSRGPVREAFRALEQIGLLRNEKNRGVFVRALSLEEADQAYTVRAVLDRFVGETLARKLDAQQCNELLQLLDELEAAMRRGDVDHYHVVNLSLHDRMVELTGNAKLLEMYRRLVNELKLLRRQALARGGAQLEVLGHEHRAIIEAIIARDDKRAGELMHDHVMHSRARLLNTFHEHEPATAPHTTLDVRPPTKRRRQPTSR